MQRSTKAVLTYLFIQVLTLNSTLQKQLKTLTYPYPATLLELIKERPPSIKITTKLSFSCLSRGASLPLFIKSVCS